MSEPLLLYSYKRCPFAIRVRTTLHEKKIPFSVKEEDLKNLSAELKSLHPQAKVPLLVHGKEVIYESAVITEYLEELFPHEPKLMPESAASRAQVRLWTFWCNQIFKPDVDRLKYGASRFPEAECVGIATKVEAHIAKLEETLTKQSLTKQSWLVDDTYSLADIHVFPFVRQLSKVTPTPAFLANYPRVNAWLATITARPAFLAAMS